MRYLIALSGRVNYVRVSYRMRKLGKAVAKFLLGSPLSFLLRPSKLSCDGTILVQGTPVRGPVDPRL
jgi:hypothetical protein